jgi:hypothetical protein
MRYGTQFLSIGLVVYAGLAVAEEPTVQRLPVVVRQALAVPSVTVVSPTVPLSRSLKPLSAEQLDGLRKAMQLLEDDYPEAATELHHRITEYELERTKQLLDEKTKTLSELPAKLEEILAPGDLTPITLSFRVLELSRTKLRDLGFDRGNIFTFPNITGNSDFDIIDDPVKVDGLIDALIRNNIIRPLAEPTLVTVNGRRAIFHSGGEVPRPHSSGDQPTANEFIKFGTSIEANPLLQKDGSLKLEFDVRLTDLDPALNHTDGGKTILGFRKLQVNSGIVARSGQTVVMSGLVQQRVERARGANGQTNEQINEIETVILVRPTYKVSSEDP